MRDASLEDFLGGGSDGEATDTDDEDDDVTGDADGDGAKASPAEDSTGGESVTGEDREVEATSTGDEDAQATVVEAPTGVFDPAGIACEDCGAERARLWHEDGRPVCRDCKSWE